MVLVVDQTLMIVSSAHGRAVVVDRAAPDVDDGLAVVDDAHRGADVGAPVEVGGEHVGHGGEALVEGPLDVGHRRRNLPRFADQPSGGSMCTSRSAGCQPVAGRVAADDRGGRAHEHGVVGELAPHHRRRAHDGVATEPGAGQDDGAGAEPRAVADHHRVVGGPLLADRHVRVGVHVVLVGDVAVRTRHDVVADDHRAVGDDVAGPADRAARRRCAARGWSRPAGSGWPGAMPTERLTWAASSVRVAERDVLLAEHVTGRERQQRAVTEVVVATRDPVLRPDGAGPLQPTPQAVGRVGGHVPPPRVERHGSMVSRPAAVRSHR